MPALVLVGFLSFGAAAAGGTTRPTGPTQLWGNLGGGAAFKAVFTGAIGDYGLSVPATAQGKATKKQNTGYRLFLLKKGTILFNTQELDAAENNNNTPPTTQNSTTCSFTFVTTEPVAIMSGTKAYAGMTGAFDVTISYAAVLPLKNGTCNPNGNAKPIATSGSVAASGNVNYGG